MTQMPPPVAYATPAPRKSAGLAITAFVLGLLGIVPVLGILLALVGIVLGIVVLAKKKGGLGFAVAGIAVGVVLCGMQALAVAVMVPTANRARVLAKRAICARNLNGIGRGIALYQADYDDASPADLNVLVSSGYLIPKSLQCPTNTAGGGSYFYLPKPVDADAACIIACDFKANHNGEGRNVLYQGGNVTWLTERAFQADLADPINADFAAALRLAEGP